LAVTEIKHAQLTAIPHDEELVVGALLDVFDDAADLHDLGGSSVLGAH
jgi:hypothetical protein